MHRESKYQQLNYYQRVQLETLLKEGKTQRYIASQIGRTQSSVSREICRNTQGKEIYLANRADERAKCRAFEQRRKAPLKSHEIWDCVRSGLQSKKWTPEVIVGRYKLKQGRKPLTVQAIYKWLHRLPTPQRDALTKHLPYFNKRRRKVNYRYQHFLSPVAERRIDYRSEEANQRVSKGHWETDNIGGKRGDRKSVSVSADRASRYVIAGVLVNLRAETKTKHLKTKLAKLTTKTITSDNGRENAGYEELEKSLQSSFYFTHPYRSWEKGSVENVIGWIRRYIPKGTSLDTVSCQKLAWVAKKYNETPKKCLNWLTPKEVFVDNLLPQNFMHFQV